MNNREECAAYFKGQPEFARIFAAMRKKWESLGRTAGRVVLPSVTEKEKRVLESFLGISLSEGQASFSMAEFEKALQETKYGGISLRELLELYFGEPLTANQEKRRNRKDREEEFWEALREEFQNKGTGGWEAASWIGEMREQKNSGYSIVMREYHRSERSAGEMLRQAASCLALSSQKGPEVRLSVLAAKTTGNPHALDRQTALGALLSYALCRRLGSEFPQNARMWKELYEKNGILTDELSSTVAAYGIHLVTEQGLHPAYEGYLAQREPCVISMANLGNVIRAYGETDKIYIVENEMVFSELLETVSEYPAAVLCTSGQPRTAAYRLMELLCRSCCSFWYAGDLDPEGLDIADRIWRTFPDRVHIWRMDGRDYYKAMSLEAVSERRLEMLKNLSSPELKKTAELIRTCRKAGYQELLLDDMAEDIKKEAGMGGA